MTRKRVWRYKCDFCKKSGCSSGHLKRHEMSCTANPNRVCKMCNFLGNEQSPLTELIAIASAKGDCWMDKLRSAANECPACMLATLRQSNPTDELYTFDFKAEMQRCFNDYAEMRTE